MSTIIEDLKGSFTNLVSHLVNFFGAQKMS